MKMDITIGKNDRVNIGDFSGTEPNIQITLKDVDINKGEEISNVLSDLCSVIYTKEFINFINEMEYLVKVNKNVLTYRDEVEKSNINEEHKKLFDRLCELVGE